MALPLFDPDQYVGRVDRDYRRSWVTAVWTQADTLSESRVPTAALDAVFAQILKWGVDWVQFGFRQRPLSQPKPDRHIIQPTRREATTARAQSGDDDTGDRSVDVRPRLIKNQKIESVPLGDADAGADLLAAIETGKS
jgi:hypothetical protein